MSAFLSFIGEGDIMVGEKVIAAYAHFLFWFFYISVNFRGKALIISISFYCWSIVNLTPASDALGEATAS